MYVYELRKIMAMYGTVLTGHYIVVFISLMVVYYKLLRFIVHVKKLQGKFMEYCRLNKRWCSLCELNDNVYVYGYNNIMDTYHKFYCEQE